MDINYTQDFVEHLRVIYAAALKSLDFIFILLQAFTDYLTPFQ